MPSRNSLSTVLVAVLALAGGIFVGYADSHSDDVHLTLALLFGFSFLVGFLKPQRVWLWALLVGIWVPVLDALLLPIGLAPQEPVWAPGNLLFVASAYGTGARVLELHQSGGKTTMQELWYDRRLQLHFGTAIQQGGYVYLSSGYDGPILMTALELKTGQIRCSCSVLRSVWFRREAAKLSSILLDAADNQCARQQGPLGPAMMCPSATALGDGSLAREPREG
jgi:hypothetical protein